MLNTFYVLLAVIYMLWGNACLNILSGFWLGSWFLMRACLSSSYILEMNTLLVALFANILSHFLC